MSQNNHMPEPQERRLLGEFLEIQRLETVNRQRELENRHAEIESNERIALKSIEAQQADSLKRTEVVSSIQKGKLWLLGLVIVALTIVISIAMYVDKTEVALELIKIGGAVLLGYFAGVARGKAQVLESQQRPHED